MADESRTRSQRSEHWLDDVARGLAGGMPRRRALRWLGGGLAGALVGLLASAEPPTAQAAPKRDLCNGQCRVTQRCCTSTTRPPVCVSIQTDSQNCGACGRRCPADFDCCGGRCVDLDTHVAHCGTCGNRCAPGQTCSGGTCRGACGLEVCGQAEVNTCDDNNHCGGCFQLCESPRCCVNGVCQEAC